MKTTQQQQKKTKKTQCNTEHGTIEQNRAEQVSAMQCRARQRMASDRVDPTVSDWHIQPPLKIHENIHGRRREFLSEFLCEFLREFFVNLF